MNVKQKRRKTKFTQVEIDDIVVAQADDDRAWEKPIRVKRLPSASLSISGELAARASFLAKLHRETKLSQWLEKVIRERVEMEEIAYRETRREMASR